jgi:hypothetical protein
MASLSKTSNEVRRDNEELRNEGHPGRPYRYDTDAVIRSILQDDLNDLLRTIVQALSISPETARTHRITQDFFGQDPLNRLLHPGYSPDISPSNFYLFWKVKSALIWWKIPDKITLVEAIIKIVNAMSEAELQGVFRRWIEPVQRVIDTGRDPPPR